MSEQFEYEVWDPALNCFVKHSISVNTNEEVGQMRSAREEAKAEQRKGYLTNYYQEYKELRRRLRRERAKRCNR